MRLDPKPQTSNLKPLPSNETLAEVSHQPEVHPDDGGNEPDMSKDTDDLPNIDMDRPLRVTFGKEFPYAPTLAELIRCRRYGNVTLQPVPLPKVGPNTPYPSVKVRTSLNARVFSWFTIYHLYCYFFHLYSVQYLVVLTFVCYINPYIMLLAGRCGCCFSGTAGQACALICALFSFCEALIFIIKRSNFVRCSVC